MAPTSPSPPRQNVVVIDHSEILSSETNDVLTEKLSEAFGRPTSLGLVAVRHVPGFVEARDAFLPLARSLALLPPEYLEGELTHEASLYNAGWSHGKERLGDKPDYAKGSFYFNPLTDLPGTEDDRRRYPAGYPPNVWPDEDRIPGFRDAARKLGRILHGAAADLAVHVDALARSRGGEGYPPRLLSDAMKSTEKAKGRLLYYFPLDENKSGEEDGGGGGEAEVAEDSWIGWHNDSGFLTALAGDIYVDHDTGEVLDPASSDDVDPLAGLYVVTRSGGPPVRVEIPKDCLAVQIGECTQIVTGGSVIATPHCVRGSRPGAGKGGGGRRRRIARISCPCFVDTPPSFPLHVPAGTSHEAVLTAGVGHDRVPPLGERWTEDGMTFGDFLGVTFARYYDWSVGKKVEIEEGM